MAQSFLPLLASRSEWLGSELGIRALISGIGTRRYGYVIHSSGVSPASLIQNAGVFQRLMDEGTPVENAEDFIKAGKAAGASILIELTALNPRDGEPALSFIRQALEAGMNVITANKGPIAHAQHKLQALAATHEVSLRYESTVLDGFPLINLSEYTLPGAGIFAFRALVNSTSNLVLSMIEKGFTLREAITEAQRIGVAEADPWYDLDGWDAAMKTTILANTLLDAHLSPGMVERRGIRGLSPDDICAAALDGMPIRLVSQGRRRNGVISAEVFPQRLAASDVLRFAVTGTDGIISLETEAMGTMTLIEHAPGVEQTAYGVFSDLVTILRQRQG